MTTPEDRQLEERQKKAMERFMAIKKLLTEHMDDLSPREQAIMKMRYGLVDGVCHTLEEVGKKFDVTRERIRQIEETCITKLSSERPS